MRIRESANLNRLMPSTFYDEYEKLHFDLNTRILAKSRILPILLKNAKVALIVVATKNPNQQAKIVDCYVNYPFYDIVSKL